MFFVLIVFNAIIVSLSAQSPAIFQLSSVNSLRAPAYPLVTIDPYTSVWSFTDKLYDENPRHWTGSNRTFIGALRVDGKVYRFMGADEIPFLPVVSNYEIENWTGKYTETDPGDGWKNILFDDSGWKSGKAPFTSRTYSGYTPWRSKDFWVRREFYLGKDLTSEELYLQFSCDDIAEISINGFHIIKADTIESNERILLSGKVIKSLKKGKNIITAHAHNDSGQTMLDFGIVRKADEKIHFDKTAIQKSLNVLPTQTWYNFDCGPVSLDLIFTSPLLPKDLYLLSRPVNYVTWQAKSNDSNIHSVQIYFEVTPEWAVNTSGQSVVSDRINENGFTFLKAGTIEQPILQKMGDDIRIDWGYLYLAQKSDDKTTMSIGDPGKLKEEFCKKGFLSGSIDKNLPEKMYLKMTALSCVNDLGSVGDKTASGYLMIGYDDISSVQYFGENLPAYWTKKRSIGIKQAFAAAEHDYLSVMKRCTDFNEEMMNDAEKAGGQKYAELCALAYRQSVAAHKLVETKDGELLFLSKENFSNGCLGTVDVTYPSSPLYLLYNTDLLKGMLNGVFYYAESGKWKHPFAPHDLGTYPVANGQFNREDGSERLMPVEESGNMVIMAAAISMMDGNADYAEKHWDILTKWTDYLIKDGLDPSVQLCTDDFGGYFGHNANLSAKAIIGIAGYGRMAAMLGKKEIASKYSALAGDMAKEWISMARDDDHYKLAFDLPGTWSQKYNLVWDKLLKFNLFPEDVTKSEIKYYLTKQNSFGLPLDSRKTYTKSDWIMWTAVLANEPDSFRRITDPVWKYVNETKTRMPVADWHDTTNGNAEGTRARSVIGGYFMKMLEQKINGMASSNNK